MQKIDIDVDEEEELEFRIRPRPMEILTMQIPKTAMEMLERVAAEQDMSVHGLLKAYIGQALRQDWQRFFPDVIQPTTAEILHRQSPPSE